MCLVYVPMLFLYHLYIVVWVTVWGSSQPRGAFIYPTLSQVLGEVLYHMLDKDIKINCMHISLNLCLIMRKLLNLSQYTCVSRKGAGDQGGWSHTKNVHFFKTVSTTNCELVIIMRMKLYQCIHSALFSVCSVEGWRGEVCGGWRGEVCGGWIGEVWLV